MSDLIQPFNERNKEQKKLVRGTRKKKPSEVPVDLDAMYARPQPDVFSADWNDGYNAGWDAEKFEVRNLNYADGYRTGQQAAACEKVELDRTGSSNA